MKLFIRGRPWLVTVDDQFLFLKEYKNLRYSYFVQKQSSLWVPILEKAVAKIKGNYDNLENGDPSNMLRLLTGAPVFLYDSKYEHLWSRL